MSSKLAVAIVVGGGPAPGINGVISAATIEAINRGYKVYGVMNGFEDIMKGDKSNIRELTLDDVTQISREGGSILCTSRANPKKSKEALENVVKVLKELRVGYLVTIGGDDTASSSGAVAAMANGEIKVAHVPKTIDNDLPLPPSEFTFGFQTAKEVGSEIVETLQTEAATTKRWCLVVAMGRTAGHLALGIGTSVSATLTIIPEEFKEGDVPLAKIVDLISATILKRKALGKGFGTVVIAEGLIEKIDHSTIPDIDKVGRDPHGHLVYADIDLGKILKDAVLKRLRQFGVKVTITEKNVGYELRCARPISFDREYTLLLGYGAVNFLLAGGTNAMISKQGRKIVPIPFENFVNPATGKAQVRLVNTQTETFVVAQKYMCKLTQEDLDNQELMSKIAGFSNSEAAFIQKELGHVAVDVTLYSADSIDDEL
jgi:6-phosphofructokinase 1